MDMVSFSYCKKKYQSGCLTKNTILLFLVFNMSGDNQQEMLSFLAVFLILFFKNINVTRSIIV